ncbi:hypothetical protein F2Q68_00035188 [Brassica cretica]|uniref:C2H2-type domain-containing protein n=1 Tax=Brassica cretica TaxID=69181 RepID=A0A8S9H0F9_BRACR|nr:hypothetical protein F2Q68_00035188 [Brassica cretica]
MVGSQVNKIGLLHSPKTDRLFLPRLEMEQCIEKRFVCKFCNKRFACGKSLGGHIRTHMSNKNSADSDEDEHTKLMIDENGASTTTALLQRMW